MQNFNDYIETLKILQNTCTKNEKLLKLVWAGLLNFIPKPFLFNNSTKLFKIDELYTSDFRVMLSNDDTNREKAK